MYVTFESPVEIRKYTLINALACVISSVLLYGKMKLLLLLVLAAVALAGQADYAKLQFAQFKEQYGKIYKTRSEHQMRFDIFQANLKKIEEHNKSGASWKKGEEYFPEGLY